MINSLPILLFLLFYLLRYRNSGEESSVLVEGATVFLFSYAVLSSLLSLIGAYDHLLIVSLLALAMGCIAVAHGIEFELRPTAGKITRQSIWFLVIAIVYLCFVDHRSDYIRMGSDAGVYCNYAKNLVAHGGGEFESQSLLDRERDLQVTQEWPAVGFFHDQGSHYYYQFFPGWPSLLALGMKIFGPYNYSYIMPLIGILAIYWLFLLLQRWLADWRLIAATFCLALNPLLVYFSKYTTSELFLFLVSAFALYAFPSGTERLKRLTLLALAAAAVSHISLFLYLPLLLTYGAYAATVGSRRNQSHFHAIIAIFLLHLVAGYWFSPQYYAAFFSKHKLFGLDLDFFYYPLLTGIAVLFFSLVVRRLAGRLSPKTLARLARLIPAWVVLLLLYSAWRGYQLGWTDDLAHLPARGAYVNQGLESVVHVTIFSVALASGVLFFLIFLAVALLPRLRPIRDAFDLFLVAGVLPTATCYFLIFPDIRHNYYLSRYFLPVMAPFIVVFALKRIARWQDWRFWATMTPALAFNLLFSGFIAVTPEYVGRTQMIREMKALIPEASQVFTLGRQETVHLLFANIARYDLQSKYGYLGEESGSGMDLLREHILDHDPESPFLVSDQEVPLGLSVSLQNRFVLTNNRYVHWGGILYPYRAQTTQETYYLYSVQEPDEHNDFSAREVAWLSPSSFWGEAGSWSNGAFSMNLPRAVGGVSRVKIETGGRFLEFTQLDQVDDEVVVEVNGISYEGMLTARAVTFDLGERLTVRTLRVRSATFVPAELGVNLDRRSLGIDIVRLVLD